MTAKKNDTIIQKNINRSLLWKNSDKIFVPISFERVYLLYGEERYLVQMYKNQLKKAIIGDDTMNLNQYTGKGLPVQEVENAVMTMPFFADRRLVLLEDTGLFKAVMNSGVILLKQFRIAAMSFLLSRR